MPGTATRNSHQCTYLGHLGRHGTDRIISFCVFWPIQERKATSSHDITDVFTNKLYQCTGAFINEHNKLDYYIVIV
jgi:hypothetical protein